jgi:hypothetical protein
MDEFPGMTLITAPLRRQLYRHAMPGIHMMLFIYIIQLTRRKDRS